MKKLDTMETALKELSEATGTTSYMRFVKQLNKSDIMAIDNFFRGAKKGDIIETDCSNDYLDTLTRFSLDNDYVPYDDCAEIADNENENSILIYLDEIQNNLTKRDPIIAYIGDDIEDENTEVTPDNYDYYGYEELYMEDSDFIRLIKGILADKYYIVD